MRENRAETLPGRSGLGLESPESPGSGFRARPVEVAEGFEFARLKGWRLAMATNKSSRKTWRSGRFWRRASSSRHSEIVAPSPLGRPSRCRPGSTANGLHLLSGNRLNEFLELRLGPIRPTKLSKFGGESISQIQ